MAIPTVQDLLADVAASPAMRPDVIAGQGAPSYPSEDLAPTSEQLQQLKEQLSAEVWLYLLRADEAGMPIDKLLVQRELQAHLARVLGLAGQNLRCKPLTSSQVVQHCQWVQYQLLHAPAAQLPAVYYEQVARAQATDARRRQAEDRIWLALSPEQQALYIQQLDQRPQEQPPAVVAAPAVALALRTSFFGALQHPGFGVWLVQELAQRPLPEIEAYLTLTWAFVPAETARRAGDSRRVFVDEDIPYLLDLLDGDWSYLTTGGRPQLARARAWFARHQAAPVLPDTPIPEQQRQSAIPSPSSNMSLRQLALRAIYEGQPMSLRQAEHTAAQWGHESGGRLYQLYRELVRSTDRLGREGRQLAPLIRDIEAVLPHLTTSARKRAEDELVELRHKK